MEALYQRPGFIIRRTQQIVLALFDEAAADLGITTTQYSVLHTLRAHPGIDQTGLCELIGIDRSTATIVLRLLEKNGLVQRQQHEGDKRRNQLMLTTEGQNMLVRAAPLSEAVSRRMREVLSEEEFTQLSDLLKTFVYAFYRRIRNPLLSDSASTQSTARTTRS
jgi:DNA-binding MarR family transcriptional regulator